MFTLQYPLRITCECHVYQMRCHFDWLFGEFEKEKNIHMENTLCAIFAFLFRLLFIWKPHKNSYIFCILNIFILLRLLLRGRYFKMKKNHWDWEAALAYTKTNNENHLFIAKMRTRITSVQNHFNWDSQIHESLR